ncbi:unnamed protein product [Phytophthora fragariaefolia]|uniref:Unnamed protein product n=1 Tax=Phytophthora fragariaefolia TaxID=1490495 RepID=A0A9W6Y0I1_9STRA|nr:unnamed protein product [Phytophthora fragariaefolia]
MPRKVGAKATSSPRPQQKEAPAKKPGKAPPAEKVEKDKTAKCMQTMDLQFLAMVGWLEIRDNHKIIVGESTSGKTVAHGVGITKIEGFKRMTTAVNCATLNSMNKTRQHDRAVDGSNLSKSLEVLLWTLQKHAGKAPCFNVEPALHTTQPISEEDDSSCEYHAEASLLATKKLGQARTKKHRRQATRPQPPYLILLPQRGFRDSTSASNR